MNLLRVVNRYSASVSDNPWKWELKNQTWNKKRSKVRKTKPFRDFIMHWWPTSEMDGQITVTTQDESTVVGELFFGLEYENDETIKGAVEVHPDYRRKGIATAMYSWGEDLTGKEFSPENNHTDAAESLWNQPNRPFGRGYHR